MKRRRKQSMPSMLFWNRRDQANFIANVERLGGVCNDLERILEPAKRKKKAAAVNGTPTAAACKHDQAEVLQRCVERLAEYMGNEASPTTLVGDTLLDLRWILKGAPA